MKQPCVSKTLGVFFNVADPEQKKLYEYAKTLFNFSGHIKKMLLAEMNGGNSQLPMPQMLVHQVQIKREEEQKFEYEVRPATPDSMI